jgi:peptidoglycan hydrolase CwlO-like protein
MDNQSKIKELLSQIEQWDKEIQNIEDMIEEAYHRIDELGGVDEIVETLP